MHQYSGYVPSGGKRPSSPAINLGGQWLAECGFLTGGQIKVLAKHGRLVLKAFNYAMMDILYA
ncbi:SymE family type I addiction module toxin [Sodalis sp. RH19]|uniref:SymE family type I addiction module toxin n=1 Tax=Sodalis sp. RH19 TaxID=3394334 RepID=UPI0039B66970